MCAPNQDGAMRKVIGAGTIPFDDVIAVAPLLSEPAERSIWRNWPQLPAPQPTVFLPQAQQKRVHRHKGWKLYVNMKVEAKL
jgi:hypothetical protein